MQNCSVARRTHLLHSRNDMIDSGGVLRSHGLKQLCADPVAR